MFRRRGFTILEMLVVMTILAVVTTMIAALFSSGWKIYRHGDGRQGLQRSGRVIIARIAPFVSSMFNGRVATAPPILEPLPGDPPNEILRFVSTEDWLAPSYPQPNNSATLATSTADLQNFNHQIVQEPLSAAEVSARFASNATVAPPREPYDLFLVRTDHASPPAEIYRRALYRSHREARLVKFGRVVAPSTAAEATGFDYRRKNLLLFAFTLETDFKGASGGRVVSETFRTFYNIPSLPGL